MLCFTNNLRRLSIRRGLATSSKASSTSDKPPTLNCAKALVKAHEGDAFGAILPLDVTTLQGIGPKHQAQLHKLRLKTVSDLANYKYYHLAKAICVLAETEDEPDGRLAADNTAMMNINLGVDKAYESWTFTALTAAPVAALQGLSAAAGETFGHVGVKTVADLAKWKYCAWAEAMQTAAKYEQQQDVSSSTTNKQE